MAEALPALQDLHAAVPHDGDIAGDTARVYVKLGRWGEGRQVLTGLLSIAPAPDDLPVPNQLFPLSAVVKDAESEQWRYKIIAIDPAAGQLGGMQTPRPTGLVEPAALVNGQLQVSQKLLPRPVGRSSCTLPPPW